MLADPEGNEFCVIEAGNNFLADTAFIGAINCDGTQEVGYFWSEALGWPLVWDQDQETAIQSPPGGTKIVVGRSAGERRRPGRTGCTSTSLHRPTTTSRRRSTDSSRSARHRIDIGQGDVSWVVMADPDGNEFCVLSPR